MHFIKDFQIKVFIIKVYYLQHVQDSFLKIKLSYFKVSLHKLSLTLIVFLEHSTLDCFVFLIVNKQ